MEMIISLMRKNHLQQAAGRQTFISSKQGLRIRKSQVKSTILLLMDMVKVITAKPWKALGVRGNHSGPISYHNVKVSHRDLVGYEGLGKDVMAEAIIRFTYLVLHLHGLVLHREL